MNLQDLFPSLQIRQFHRDSPVKTSRTKLCRIQGIRTVGCCQNDNTYGSIKSVHLSQQLVQSLFSLIITAGLPSTFPGSCTRMWFGSVNMDMILVLISSDSSDR